MALLDDILAHLVTNTVVDGATGWTGYKGYLPDSPDQSVVISDSGGGTPDATDSTKYDFPTFQVRVRGGKFAYDLCRTKMQDVFDNLHDATVSGYIYVFAIESGPLPMGYDQNNRPELSMNFQTMKAR